MIITNCPYCNEPQVFGWEAGDPNGWFPSKCYKCKEVMWVEATSFGGETITHDEFKDIVMKPGDEQIIENAKNNAINQSTIVYDKL